MIEDQQPQQPKWQPRSMLPILTEMTETAQVDAKKPYVFDDHTVDRMRSLSTEALELTGIGKEQLDHWCENTAGPLDRTETGCLPVRTEQGNLSDYRCDPDISEVHDPQQHGDGRCNA
ncbi:MAG: hypothetical protein OXE84_05370 [Rhodobacteraceae bacterium]|nr:hypothetical protein [Paracoccaceae bacterium]MCY4197214.1 hypothetical protein [Paracoccaceae bacterium]MCY4326587.1 hypothetical protein [Paracoccaceae bacterium]